MPTKHLLIEGEVQGVFYRVNAKKAAEEFNIRGWVKNTLEGHVEVLASGSNDNLEKFIQWCRQGPPSANVTAVAINDLAETAFESFKIKRGNS